MSPIDKCCNLLKELDNSVLYSSQSDSWKSEDRDDFISSINCVHYLSEIGNLFDAVKSFENAMKWSKQNESWKQWKRKYWRLLANEEIGASNTITRFIVVLKYLEDNMLYEAHNSSWKSDRITWLEKCNDLIDPLQEVAFYDWLYQNVCDVVEHYGYSSLSSYGNKVSNVIREIRSTADLLDEVAQNTGAADAVAGGMGIASGVLAGVGLLAAPFTAGGSLVLTGAGTVLGVGSAATGITSTIIGIIYDETKAKEVQKEIESVTAETMGITTLLANYATSTQNLKTKLNSLGKLRAIEYIQKASTGAMNVINGMKNTSDIVRMAKVVATIRPDLLDEGFGMWIAFEGAAPGLQTPGILKTLFPDRLPKFLIQEADSLASAASKLSGFLSVLSIGFGIWQTVSAVKKMEEGSALAKEFRDLAKNFKSAKQSIMQSFDT